AAPPKRPNVLPKPLLRRGRFSAAPSTSKGWTAWSIASPTKDCSPTRWTSSSHWSMSAWQRTARLRAFLFAFTLFQPEHPGERILWVNTASPHPGNELGQVHTAVGGFAVEDPALRLLQPLTQVALCKPSVFP